MSYAEKPDLPLWARFVVLTLVVAGIILSLGNLFVWFMGPCPAFSSNTVCTWGHARTLWLFPGSQVGILLAIALSVRFLRKWTTK